jgi:hypothetical protein
MFLPLPVYAPRAIHRYIVTLYEEFVFQLLAPFTVLWASYGYFSAGARTTLRVGQSKSLVSPLK